MRYGPKIFGLLVGFAVGAIAAELILSSLGLLAGSRLVPILLAGLWCGWVGYGTADHIDRFLGIVFVRYWLLAFACWSMLLLMAVLWGFDVVGVDRLLGPGTSATASSKELLAVPLFRTRILVLWLGPPFFGLVALSLWHWARSTRTA
jgi:hypothetical protein